ncbi:MAG: sulfotransferase domain-containing protein [Rhodospirillales bacterium]|nr:sulfotransferase domain-containing protein [Rhodospirillales bacterium]
MTKTATKFIIVSGYPKSGNTWCTRLVAEAIGCPSRGYLGRRLYRGKRDITTEGLDRVSDFAVWKSHHEYLWIREVHPRVSVLHIVRDPRDVAVSGALFFTVDEYNQFYGTDVNCFEAMVRTVCDGGINNCKRPWAQWVRPYLEGKTLTVRYEDLLDDPLRELQRIMLAWGISRSETALHAAIEKQSFATTLKQAKASGKSSKIKIVRNGQTGDFRKYLTAEQIARIEASCKAEMAALGYEA